MFNRIRVVTMLMMVLGVFALLQLVSGGLLFSSLQQNQQKSGKQLSQGTGDFRRDDPGRRQRRADC